MHPSGADGPVGCALGIVGQQSAWHNHLATRGWNALMKPAVRMHEVYSLKTQHSELHKLIYSGQTELFLIGVWRVLKMRWKTKLTEPAALTSSSAVTGCFLRLRGQSAMRCSGEASPWKRGPAAVGSQSKWSTFAECSSPVVFLLWGKSPGNIQSVNFPNRNNCERKQDRETRWPSYSRVCVVTYLG